MAEGYRIGKTGNTTGRKYGRKKKDEETTPRPRPRPAGVADTAVKAASARTGAVSDQAVAAARRQDSVGAGSNQAYSSKYRPRGDEGSGKGAAAAADRPAPRPSAATTAERPRARPTTAVATKPRPTASSTPPKARPAASATTPPQRKKLSAGANGSATVQSAVRKAVETVAGAPKNTGNPLASMFKRNAGNNQRKAKERQARAARKG
jgi:hypothetical protein